MVANVALDSSAVSLLTAYNHSVNQSSQVQNAVSTGYDVSKASDNPIFYLEAKTLRSQANAYSSYIPKLTQDKSALDRLQSTISNITDTATKLQSVITSMSTNPTGAETSSAATQIKSYLLTIQNLIQSSGDGNGFNLSGGKSMTLNVAPNISPGSPASPTSTMTYTPPQLTIFGKTGMLAYATASNGGDIDISNANGDAVADVSTATNRASLLSSVSNWINNTLSQAATSVGAFSNALDAQLSAMQTNQNGLNAEADALTKTDLTADSAKSTALQTQQQLLTNLLSMSNQRAQTVLSLFR